MKHTLTMIAAAVAAVAAGGAWYLHAKQPLRNGSLVLVHLQVPVDVRYDKRGASHLYAQNQTGLYRVLGYVHAQDRLFQMEMLRRLARGELAEVLGAELVDTDRLFRTLRIHDHAAEYSACQDKQSRPWKVLEVYLDGVNQFQENNPAPLEFDLLSISRRPFTPEDTPSIAGYMAYSFAAAFRTESVLTYIRDELGSDYLRIFDLDWHPQGVLTPSGAPGAGDWKDPGVFARLSQQALEDAGLPQFESSNAWVVAGSRTASGKPLLVGDPHIRFAVSAVWYEAQLGAPGFELYGHHQALNPFALLGHDRTFGWSLTMFQNDDLDLITERVNLSDPNQAWYQGKWVDLQSEEQEIAVKGTAPVKLTLRRSPHGPIVDDTPDASSGETPIAMWWAFLETENPVLDALYQLNRTDTLAKARAAASKIHSPGFNLVWANAAGDIGWWTSTALPKRPEGVNPSFTFDGSKGEADKSDFYPSADNPQEKDPARGHIVSANFQPVPANSRPIPGYYNLADHGQWLDIQLADRGAKWNLDNSHTLQLGDRTGYVPRLLAPLLPVLREVVDDAEGKRLVERLAAWKGGYPVDSTAATLFNQLLFQIVESALCDELGDAFFNSLIATRAIDSALPRLAGGAGSPQWDDRRTERRETRADIVRAAWNASLAHLCGALGNDPSGWLWGRAHTLTHEHTLGQQTLFKCFLNVGPFATPGTYEVPNNLSAKTGPAPWAVTYGPLTRRLVNFADPTHSLGINPVGQNGVPFDGRYDDQAEAYIEGHYLPQYYEENEVKTNSKDVLVLEPKR